jgi:hypothetical protein
MNFPRLAGRNLKQAEGISNAGSHACAVRGSG